jgi:hypothetical protein
MNDKLLFPLTKRYKNCTLYNVKFCGCTDLEDRSAGKLNDSNSRLNTLLLKNIRKKIDVTTDRSSKSEQQ